MLSPDTSAGPAAGRTLIQAAAIGLLASAIGLVLSVGVGPGLAYLFDAVANTSLRLPGVRMPAGAVVAAFGAGQLAAVLAATPVVLRARAARRPAGGSGR